LNHQTTVYWVNCQFSYEVLERGWSGIKMTKQLGKDGYRTLENLERPGDGFYFESVVCRPDGNRIEWPVNSELNTVATGIKFYWTPDTIFFAKASYFPKWLAFQHMGTLERHVKRSLQPNLGK